MNGRTILWSLLCLAVFVAASAFTIFRTHRMFTTSGPAAVAAMDSEERAALERLSRIDSTMNTEQVFDVLGPPAEDMYLLATWRGFGGSLLSEVRVYFRGEHPTTVRWIKLGHFIYERSLLPADQCR